MNPAVSNGSAIGNVSFYSATTDFGGIAYALDSGSTTAGNMKFYTASSSTPVLVMTMLSTGNVGIGTTEPSEKLEVAGKILSTAGMKVIRNDYYANYANVSLVGHGIAVLSIK